MWKPGGPRARSSSRCDEWGRGAPATSGERLIGADPEFYLRAKLTAAVGRGVRHLSVTRSRILTFMVAEELDLQPDFVREVGGWIGQGRLHFRETVVDGLDNTLEAFFRLMRGESQGKMVVRL